MLNQRYQQRFPVLVGARHLKIRLELVRYINGSIIGMFPLSRLKWIYFTE